MQNLFFQTPLDRQGMASLQSRSTFSFKHHLIGKAWQACRAIVPFHSNTTRQVRHGQLSEQIYLYIQTPLDRRGMASLQSNSTSSFKHHLRQAWHAWHGLCISYIRPLQLAEQFYLFIQTPHDRRGMASLHSNSTFSFKHHLTGEPVLPLGQCPPSKLDTL